MSAIASRTSPSARSRRRSVDNAALMIISGLRISWATTVDRRPSDDRRSFWDASCWKRLIDSVSVLTPTTRLSPFSSAVWYWKAASAISDMNQPSSMPRRMPAVIVPSEPMPRIRSKIASASASSRSVSASTYQDPPIGSATLVTPISSISTCWVRSAISAACSLGRAKVSSKALVCNEFVPPSTAASASTAVRTTLL